MLLRGVKQRVESSKTEVQGHVAVSALGVMLFWDVLPGGPKLGAALDVVIPVALLGVHWPSGALVGA